MWVFRKLIQCGKHLIGFVSFLLIVSSASAADNDGTIAFDIPSQPLVTALEAFGTSSGFQILLADAGTGARRSNAVKGILTARDALIQLVAGAGFAVRFTSEKSAILVPDGPRTIASLRGAQSGPLQVHETALQRDVMRALCADTVTQPGSYRAALDLWITPTGRVDRAELLASTGDQARDDRILQRLVSLQSSPPPRDVSQPTTLIILPPVAELGGGCAGSLPVGKSLRAGMP